VPDTFLSVHALGARHHFFVASSKNISSVVISILNTNSVYASLSIIKHEMYLSNFSEIFVNFIEFRFLYIGIVESCVSDGYSLVGSLGDFAFELTGLVLDQFYLRLPVLEAFEIDW